MSKVFIRDKINLKKINFIWFLAVLPMVLAGFYKNGIKLYNMKLVSIYGMFKPLIFVIIGFIIGILVNIIYERIIKKSKENLSHAAFSSFHPFYGVLVASTISINTNLIIFSVCVFICFLISKFFNNSLVNSIALTSLLIILITDLLGDFSYLNVYEKANNLNLGALDYLIGRGSGGINTTHVILLIVSLIILGIQNFYKKEIPIYSSIVFLILITGYSIYKNMLGDILDIFFSNGILFSYVFVASDTLSSPYTQKGRVIYSLIIGIFTFGLYLVYPPLSALGAIVLASIASPTIDKICSK